MSQISLKSISGITSITTPAGVDNRFSLYNFDSTERFVLDHSGNLNISGVSTATTFSGSGASLTNLPSAQLTGALPAISGASLTNLPSAQLTGALPAISGASLTNLNASNIASGTVPTARLGSGTASSSTFLAGDSTYKTVTGTTINNNANNRLITGSGTANTLEGEANLTFDGTVLTTDQIRYASGGNKYHGHPRSVVIGYSGSNYANLGMGWVPTSTNDQYTSANSDYQSRLGLYDGLQIYGSGASVTSGQTVTWKNVADFKPSAIKLYTSGNSNSEKLHITSDGQVTKPSQVGFHATGTSTYNRSSNFVPEFNTEYFDIGGGYNNSNYRFTAPVTGRYFLYFQYLTYPNSDPDYKTFLFRKNGSSSGLYDQGFYRGREGQQGNQTSQQMSTYIQLAENDYVEPYVEMSGGTFYNYMGSGHSHFWGFLVH